MHIVRRAKGMDQGMLPNELPISDETMYVEDTSTMSIAVDSICAFPFSITKLEVQQTAFRLIPKASAVTMHEAISKMLYDESSIIMQHAVIVMLIMSPMRASIVPPTNLDETNDLRDIPEDTAKESQLHFESYAKLAP